MSNKFTVIIPTRERAGTLLHSLRTCVSQDYDNFRIIVSDNASKDNTRDVVQSFHDKRMIYVNTGQRVSMTDNFEFGLGHSQDGFVMFMGDDDGLLPDAITRVNQLIEKYGSKAVLSSCCSYSWPDHQNVHQQNSIHFPTNHRLEIRNSDEWIRKTLSFVLPYTSDLPSLYYGFADKTIINAMTKDGRFFRSINPDAYSAFAIACAVDSFIYSGTPFVITGLSGKSNVSSMLVAKDKTHANNFLSENTLPFHRDLVMSPSLRLATAESFLQLKDAFPEKAARFRVDIPKALSAALCEGNTRTAQSVRHAVDLIGQKNGYKVGIFSFLKMFINIFFHKASDGLKRLFQIPRRVVFVNDAREFGVNNINDAVRLIHFLLALNDGARPRQLHFIVRKLFDVFRRYL